MNKLSRSGSDLDLMNEDYTFMQDAFGGAFKGLCSAFGIGQSDSFVLSGCEITENAATLDIAAGYVALGGEICQVDAHSVAKYDAASDPAGHNNFWLIAPTYDASGVRPIQTGGSENTWVVRKGKVVLEEEGLNPVRFDLDIPIIHELAASKIKTSLISEINNLTTQLPAQTALNGWVVSLLLVTKDAFGNVTFSAVLNGSVASADQIMVLPSGWGAISFAPTNEAGKFISLSGYNLTSDARSIIHVNFSYKTGV